jgi:hypothetical protein
MTKFIAAIRAYFASSWGVATGIGAFMVGIVTISASPALAQAYTVGSAKADVTSFIGDNFTSVGALILAVAGSILGLVVLMWGIKWVLGLFSGRRTKVS